MSQWLEAVFRLAAQAGGFLSIPHRPDSGRQSAFQNLTPARLASEENHQEPFHSIRRWHVTLVKSLEILF